MSEVETSLIGINIQIADIFGRKQANIKTSGKCHLATVHSISFILGEPCCLYGLNLSCVSTDTFYGGAIIRQAFLTSVPPLLCDGTSKKKKSAYLWSPALAQ